MAGYIHKADRDRRAAAAPWRAIPASLREQLVAQAAEELLGHRQKVEAGVPGCSCSVDFSSYQTMPLEHSRHAAEEIVDTVLAALFASGMGQPAEREHLARVAG